MPSLSLSEPILEIVGIAVAIMAGSAAIVGYLAYSKRRPPLEGVLLGLLLGPIGILIEWRLPYVQRPPVDKNALNSLRSMLDFQEAGREYDRRKSRSETSKG